MANGILITDGTPRTLSLDGVTVGTGGQTRVGIHSSGDTLYVDGAAVNVSANNGFGILGGSALTFKGNGSVDTSKITGVIPPGTPEPQPVVQTLWVPPTQEASSYTPYTYAGLISRYDALMNSHPSYITKTIYTEQTSDGYSLYYYTLTPTTWTKTWVIQTGIHGNEHDAPQTILRIVDILCNHTSEPAYSALAPIRNNVRIFLCPCLNPYGWDNASMNRPYIDWFGNEQSMNMNRNFDNTHQYALDSAGTGGNYPFQVAETRMMEHIVEIIGKENIDYFFDFHDGGNVYQHFWINYDMDRENAEPVRTLVSNLIAYEEQNYPQYKHNGQWVTDYCTDEGSYSSGVNSGWTNYTLGILGSVCEYIGGYFGYTFNAEQMTRSLRIRANMLLTAYGINAKGWTLSDDNTGYFNFKRPVSMTRQGLRRDGVDETNSHTIVSFSDVYDRWDALVTKYPSKITKSASLGQNLDGDDVYYYTIGNGATKVLLVGGSLRWGAAHKETEFGFYLLAEYLCNDEIVAQSSYLQSLRQNYTIAVLPCVNIKAGGNGGNLQGVGLNSMALPAYYKWQISNGVCVPTTYGDSNADISVFRNFITANSTASKMISGGEDDSGYQFENGDNKYNQNYMTQVILPLNQTANSGLNSWCSYVHNTRGESAVDVEHTDGKSIADYVYDNYGMDAYYLNLKVDTNNWDSVKQYACIGEKDGDGARYFYRTYETGRRLSHLVNLILI